MKAKHVVVVCVVLAMGALFVAGCASTPPKEVAKGPDWVWKGSGAFDAAKGKIFYGVGVASGIRNKALLRSSCDNRARAELGKTIITHVTSKNLIISSTSCEYSSQLIDTLSDTDLNFTEVVERWHDRSGCYGPSNHYYVLLRLEKKRAESILRSMK